MGDDELLIRVKAAAVNPVDMLNLTGAVRLIQDDSMPLTLGNECAGIVEKAGRHVTRFRPGDRVYARLPVGSLGQMAVPAARRWVCASSSRRRSTMPCSGWRAHRRKSDSPSPIILSGKQRLEKSGCCFHVDTVYQIMHGGYRNTLFADCLQKIGGVPFLTLDKYPQGVYNADTPWGYT